MLDPVIQAFFDERRQAWLKKELKASMDDVQIRALEAEADERFSLEVWLPDAAKRAGQISIATHPCTFSHPSARKNKNGSVTSIIANAQRMNDGFVRSGNAEVLQDALGNAAALDVHKFLSTVLNDQRSLLEHIQQDTEQAKLLLTIKSASYEQLREGFLAMVNSASDEVVTSSKIKQVYFPLFPEEGEDDEYHLLSVLTNSGLVFELRKRLDALRFGYDPEKADDHIKQGYLSKDELNDARNARKEAKPYSNFDEIYGLTSIAYGGTKPQNISVLNNQNGGTAHLLMSAPPSLAQREVRFPKQDFFTQSIRFIEAREGFQALHRIFATHAQQSDIPLKNLVNARDNRLNDLLDLVVERMWAVRAIAGEQYHEPSSQLKVHQALWLLQENEVQRFDNDDWLEKIVSEITQWLIAGYKKVIKEPVPLGDSEIQFIQEFVDQFKEALR